MKRNHLLLGPCYKVAILVISMLVLAGGRLCAQAPAVKNILLIHGVFADGSGWQEVFKLLTAKGYNVTVVQNPSSSLEEDVAAVKRAMDRETGSCILVGHSYGGAVITEAGSDDRVVGLVYVDGFVPDSGETAVAMDPSVPDLTNGGIVPDASGLIWFDKAKFHAGFCADLPAGLAAFMSCAQIPGSLKAFTTMENKVLLGNPGHRGQVHQPDTVTAAISTGKGEDNRDTGGKPCQFHFPSKRSGAGH